MREAFFQLFKDGLIYRGKRLVNWDPATQTALADDEVEMEEVDGHFYYLQYPLDDGEAHGQRGSAYVTVATTRPETMLGDTAVAINPKDPRARRCAGRRSACRSSTASSRSSRTITSSCPTRRSDDPKAKFATGFLKVTPAHDPNDYEIGLRHKLPMINVLAPGRHDLRPARLDEGRRRAGDAEFLLGLDRFEAREAVVEWFKQNNLLEEVKPYRHSVGHSYRSHVPIEPYLSDQWYCKVTDDRLARRGAARDVRASSIDSRPWHGRLARALGEAIRSKHAWARRPCYERVGRPAPASSPRATPRRSRPGTRTSATGASAASSGGDIGFRCGDCREGRLADQLSHDAFEPIVETADRGRAKANR